jgi:hypothetical protein
MSQESQSAKDNTDQKRRKRPEWVSQLVFPVIVAVLGAVLVTALTPLGASLRELLFHTRATVAGSVTIDGKPAASAHLKLDGADSGDTDAGGRFLLTEVSKGQHRLHLELLGAKPRDEVFSVASGQTALQVGNLEMEPLVRLAYRPSVQLSAQGFDYDITLWIIGDPDVLSRIKSVSYTLPTPLSSRPVSGADANHAFCYRQTGTLPLQGSSGNGAPVLALAVVDLGAGQKFQISAPAGTTQPPDCPAHQAGPASTASATPAPSQQPFPSPSQSGSPPASPTIPVPSVIRDSQATASQILTAAGFAVSVQQGSGPTQYTNGTVFDQAPRSGANAAKGSTVTIDVQNGASPSSPTPTPGP